jgi:anti-anti-sigma factor
MLLHYESDRRTRLAGGWTNTCDRLTIHAKRQGAVVILELSGQLVLGCPTNCLRRMAAALEQAGHRLVVLNLKDVSKIDTAGLGVIEEYVAVSNRNGGSVTIVRPSRSYSGQLLVETKIVTLAPTSDREDKAIDEVVEYRCC